MMNAIGVLLVVLASALRLAEAQEIVELHRLHWRNAICHAADGRSHHDPIAVHVGISREAVDEIEDGRR